MLSEMKVCDVTQFYSPVSGGVKRYVSEKQRYVASQPYGEHYLIIPGEQTEHRQEGRLHTLTIQSPRLDQRSRYRIILNTRLVRDWLGDIRPDVIESGDPYHVAWTALRAGEELHTPVMGFYHSHFPEAYLRTALKFGGSWIRDVVMNYAQDYIVRLYSKFRYTLVPSEHLRNLLESWGVDNAVTVRLGVDTESFCPGPRDTAWRAELGVPEDATVLLYVGRLSGEKNIETLLEAFRQLKRRNDKNYWLVVVGDGPLRRCLPSIREETKALVWKHYVSENRELARYYRMADLFVHPGVVETFGLVTLEAQACGCPVVGIRGSYMDANIFAGLEQWASDNSPEALAQAVQRLSDADREALGSQAARAVHERFSWAQVFGDLWQYYDRARRESWPGYDNRF
jgi:alpha-1,6-mannosyltransferase